MALDLSLHERMSRSYYHAILDGLQREPRGSVWEGSSKGDKAKRREANRVAGRQRALARRRSA